MLLQSTLSSLSAIARVVVFFAVHSASSCSSSPVVAFFTATTKIHRPPPPRPSLARRPRAASFVDDPGRSDDDVAPTTIRRSVSDYMGGHHAGKFDFDPRLSGVTAVNYEKSVVFEDDEQPPGPILAKVDTDDDERPRWASRDVRDSSSLSLDAMTTGEVRVGGRVIVTNEERSWETFYAAIESDDDGDSEAGGLRVDPNRGVLAPRGGSNNACDECRPYADAWELTLSSTESDGDADVRSDAARYVVVRTEQERWVWRVVP